MALTRQQLNALYRKTFNRDIDESGLATYSPFNDEASVEKDLMNSQEYKMRAKAPQPSPQAPQPFSFQATRANSPQRQELLQKTQINPLSADEFNAFKLQSEQFYNPLRQASQDRLAKFKEQAALDQRDLEQRLREQAGLDVKGLEQSLQNRGLLFSGSNVAGQSRIQENVSKDISRAAVQRALQESERVLQEAQTQSGIDQQISDRAAKLAEQEFGRRQQSAQSAKYGLDILDSETERDYTIQQQEQQRLLAAQEQAYKLQQQQAAFDADINKVQEVDLGDRVVLIDPTGRVVSEYKKGKLPSSGGSSSGFDPVLASILGFQQGQANATAQPLAELAPPEPLSPKQERELQGLKYQASQDSLKAIADNPKSQARKEANAKKVQPPKPQFKVPTTTNSNYLPSTTPAWLANRGKR